MKFKGNMFFSGLKLEVVVARTIQAELSS